jgi:type III restriction enzyme
MMHNFFRGLDSNSPDAYPARHWELGDDGQPTNRIIDSFHHAVDAAPALLPAELTSNLLVAKRVI